MIWAILLSRVLGEQLHRLGRLFWSLCVINRTEFTPVEITIFAMPLLVALGGVAGLGSPIVREGTLVFLVIFAMGNMINCLADRERDRTYKGRLARAVDHLGVGFVTWLVRTEAVAAFLLGTHLAWVMGSWAVLILVYLELFLAVQYSVGPLHFKSRGLAQLPCLWLVLYVLPMLFFALLPGGALTWPLVALAASFGTIQMGIVLVNTSEDLPEDVAEGIRTITVALGLRRTLWLAAGMVLLGGLGFAATWAYLLLSAAPLAWGVPALLSLLAVCGYTAVGVGRLARRVATANSEDGVRLVKTDARLVPLWCTLVGWVGLACGLIHLLTRQS
jgi:4-hydroxybenzoate polyprenyltransferase